MKNDPAGQKEVIRRLQKIVSKAENEGIILGRQICEVHMKENGQLLGKGVVDFEKIKKALDHISYEGWGQIEGAVPQGGDMLTSYVTNNQYLRQLFKA